MRLVMPFDCHDAVALYFNISLISSFVEAVLRIGGVTITRSNIVICLTIVTFLVVLFQQKLLIKKYFILTIIVWMLIVSSAVFVSKQETKMFTETISDGITHILIPVFLFSQIKSIDLVVLSLRKYIPITVLFCLMQFFYRNNSTAYYFSFTYSVIVTALLLFTVVLEEGGKKNIIYLSIVILSMFLFGGRSALLCFAVAFFLHVLLYKDGSKRFFVCIIICLVLFFIYFFWDLLLELLIKFFPNARFIMFLSGEVKDNYRSSVWSELIGQVLKQPFVIRGILSDRVAIGQYYGVDSSRISGMYAHNFVVEFLYEFGLLGGGVLLIFLKKFCHLVIEVRNSDNKSIKLLFIIFATYFLGKLSVSSSYLIDLATGGFVGMIFVLNDYFSGNIEKPTINKY